MSSDSSYQLENTLSVIGLLVSAFKLTIFLQLTNVSFPSERFKYKAHHELHRQSSCKAINT